MGSILARTILITASVATMSANAAADQTVFDWPGGVSVALESSPAFTIGQLHDEIASVYGAQLANEIATELGSSGSIGFMELTEGGSRGKSDVDTIAIDSLDVSTGGENMSEFEAAMTIVHEYQHVLNIRSGPSGDGHDPLTSDPLCGSCQHALMHYEQMLMILSYGCQPETCTQLRCERLAAEHWMHGDTPCLPSDCASLFGAVTTAGAGATLQLQQCCD